MKILILPEQNLREAILSTAVIAQVAQTYPDASLTVLSPPEAAELLYYACSQQEVTTITSPLWQNPGIISRQWDLVVDLQNTRISRLVRAEKRYVLSSEHVQRSEEERQALIDSLPNIEFPDIRHRIEQYGALLELQSLPAPQLFVSPEDRYQAARLIDEETNVIALGLSAEWPAYQWPLDRFVELMRQITHEEGLCPGACIYPLSHSKNDPALKILADQLPAHQIVLPPGETGLAQMGANLERCRLFIGNDSPLLHLAAASGVPTFGLFSASHTHLSRPWGAHTDYIRAPMSYATLSDLKGAKVNFEQDIMGTLEVDLVMHQLKKFWHSVGTDTKAA